MAHKDWKMKIKNLVMALSLTMMPIQAISDVVPVQNITPIVSYLLSSATFSYADFVGKTKYFFNENGGVGYRTYNDTDYYTGSFNESAVEGTYAYSETLMTLNRSDGMELVFTNPRATIYGDGITSDLSVNGGVTSKTHNYDTEQERDIAYIESMSYTYGELASNTYYGVDEDGLRKLVTTYAQEGNASREMTFGSFEHSATPAVQSFEIIDNVITLGTGATITRIGIYADYSHVLYDHDGAGAGVAILRRIYADKTKAEEYYNVKALSYTYEELASNTYYGVVEASSIKYVTTYEELGDNNRDFTFGSFEHSDTPTVQSFEIIDNVITLLGTGATITRRGIVEIDDDSYYSHILYDPDGAGGDEPSSSRRTYLDIAEAQAYVDSL